MADRQWTITINAPGEWHTANIELDRHRKGRLVYAWRTAALAAAQAARLPKGLTCVGIGAVARFKAGGRAPVRDRDNLRPTLKAVIDGLGPKRMFVRNRKLHVAPGYGLIVDDSDQYLAYSDITIGPRLPVKPYGPFGLLVVTITEVTDA